MVEIKENRSLSLFNFSFFLSFFLLSFFFLSFFLSFIGYVYTCVCTEDGVVERLFLVQLHWISPVWWTH